MTTGRFMELEGQPGAEGGVEARLGAALLLGNACKGDTADGAVTPIALVGEIVEAEPECQLFGYTPPCGEIHDGVRGGGELRPGAGLARGGVFDRDGGAKSAG